MTRLIKAYFSYLYRDDKTIREKILKYEITPNKEMFGFECDNVVQITFHDGSHLCFIVEVDGKSHDGHDHLNQYRDAFFEKLEIKTFRVSSRKIPEQRDLKSSSERLHAVLRYDTKDSVSFPPHIESTLERVRTLVLES